MKFNLLIFALLAGTCLSYAQEVTNIHYEAREIGSGYIYDVAQAETGELLLATDNGLVYFNGKLFTRKSEADALAEDFVTQVSCEDGRQVLGHLSRGISSLDGEDWTASSDRRLENSRVLCLEQSSGLIYAGLANGDFVIVDEQNHLEVLFSRPNDPVRRMIRIKDELVVATERIIATIGILDGGVTIKDSLRVEGGVKQVCADKARRRIYVATTDGYFTVLGLVKQLQEYARIKSPELLSVVDAASAMTFDVIRKRVWLGTKGKGLYSYRASSDSLYLEEILRSPSEIAVDNIESLFIDVQGNLWIGGFGDGLTMIPVNGPRLFVPKQPITSCVLIDRYVYASDETHIIKINRANLKPVDTISLDLELESINILASYKSKLIIAADPFDLYLVDIESREVEKLNDRFSNRFLRVNSVAILGDKIGICTEAGFYLIQGKKTFSFTIANGLASNRVLCADQDLAGRIFLGHDGNGVDIISNEEVRHLELPEMLSGARVNTIKLLDDEIWMSIIGRGLYHLTLEGELVAKYGAANQLESDYINASFSNAKNDLYVLGLNSYAFATMREGEPEFWNRNIEALTCYPNTFRHLGTSTLIGTNRGLYKFSDYIPSYAQRVFPVDLHHIRVNGHSVLNRSGVNLDYGFHDLQIEFTTVNFFNNSRQFEFKLAGFEDTWRTKSVDKGFANYTNLGPGEYTFLVRIANRPNTELSFNVSISKPYWQKGWFYVLMAIIVFALVSVIIWARERYHQRQELVLTREVHKKTSIIREHNETIKRRSAEIESSIRYASKIQSSMLAGKEDLKLRFPGSILLYQPKDIVSGDFYWIKTKGDHMYVVAADCTGHGVPGAMMSMIGTVHLNTILFQEGIEAPKDILTRLDTKLSRSLSQSARQGTTDGMDISIVKIDLKTNKMLFTGAMHPLWHFSSDGFEVTRGTRRWIGGTSGIDINLTDFEEHEIKPSKGDVIFLFSDGMIDQFGGPLNKKLKAEKMMKMLRIALNEVDTNGRELALLEQFEKWRGSYEQTDDLLVIGIQF